MKTEGFSSPAGTTSGRPPYPPRKAKIDEARVEERGDCIALFTVLLRIVASVDRRIPEDGILSPLEMITMDEITLRYVREKGVILTNVTYADSWLRVLCLLEYFGFTTKVSDGSLLLNEERIDDAFLRMAQFCVRRNRVLGNGGERGCRSQASRRIAGCVVRTSRLCVWGGGPSRLASGTTRLSRRGG